MGSFSEKDLIANASKRIRSIRVPLHETFIKRMEYDLAKRQAKEELTKSLSNGALAYHSPQKVDYSIPEELWQHKSTESKFTSPIKKKMNREEANHLYHRFVEHEKRKQQAIRMI